MNAAGPTTPRGNRGSAIRRRGFGLDTLLPADPTLVEAGVLRLLSSDAPEVIAIRPANQPDRPPSPGHRAVPSFVAGAPDLLLLLPGGKSACLRIRSQAERLSRDQVAFRDLCGQRGIPYAVVRSLAEARSALVRFGAIREDRA